MSERKAPKRPDGLCWYIVTTTSWGRSTQRPVLAPSLAEAKAQHGYTRALHTSVRVHRATEDEINATPTFLLDEAKPRAGEVG